MMLSRLSRVTLVVLVVFLNGCASNKQQTDVSSQSAQTRLQLGMEYLAANNLDAARQNLDKAVKGAPDDYRTQLGMALYEQRVGENAAAQNRYRLALKLAPQNGTVLNNYGAFLCSLGQYVPAQQQFVAAAQAADYGLVADSLENAGYCFYKAGKNDEARKLLSRALKYDPEKGVTLLAEADRKFSEGKGDKAQLLLNVYQHILPASAESLWLQIRFAALAGRQNDVKRYGARLARSFPHSKQYQQFLANEY
ncbi:type IV pilus biogenesis/stability protein PilW [Acerihabitans sp. TG2]|uniref:type IV pilus biogenesis/stability protein PilW n=1 Tax=Acerihabitans sp. TG2 TaxID=3096008 RepID=UPI002B226AD1|nr:type IV pilus biogenesis/stability protein PilW [Acerihabitans sp. TG2]MEA9392467.1 type IV pilus biogenesis/stability protein PilW [Acerihabitans sp. TG2]